MVSDGAHVLPASLRRHRAAVVAEMRQTLDGRTLPIYDMARYALGWQDASGRPLGEGGGGGKILRPALCLLGASAVDTSPEARSRAMAGAAAVEFVHNFSLVHDDIQDQDEERHGRPTVWRTWSAAQAINAGDTLRELADVALRRALEAGASAETVLEATARLNRAALEMIEGQYLDLSFEGEPRVGAGQYLDMIERKTGAMMGVSLALGGLLGGADRERVDALDRAGRRLGLCFQIRDDYLGIWGDSAATGKSTDNDIRRRKKSFPIVHTLDAATAATRDALERCYGGDGELSDNDVEAISALLAEAGAPAATEQAARDEYEACRRELEACRPLPAAAEELAELAAFILHRDR